MEAQKPKIEPTTPRDERETASDDRARGSESAQPTKAKEATPAHSPSRTTEGGSRRGGKAKNNVRKLRMERMMSKAELARRASVSTLTVDRVERGMPCRMDTKRKILEALSLKPSDRVMVFGDSPDEDD
jgi:DNA-binding XRE family transcriptional regulator